MIEAIDDRGRSLASAPGGPPTDRSSLVFSRSGAFRIEPALAMPDPPGASIARLKAAVPLVYNLPRADVIDVPLAAVPGRTFEGSGAKLEILAVGPNPPGKAPGTAVVLSFRSKDGKPPALRTLTFLGADGRERFGLETARTPAGDGFQLAYEFRAGPPARVRYATTARASVTVTIDLAGIPLP